MDSINELKKFKELLEQGVITEDEFNKKKTELLGLNENKSANMGEKVSKSKPIKMNKNKKMIFALLGAVVLIIALLSGISKISSSMKAKAECREAEEKIASLMSSYGLEDFKVISASSALKRISVLCADYENLNNDKKYEVDKAIRLKGYSVDIYVNSRDHYYFISPLWAAQSGNSYNCGGLYKYDGNRYCVYEVTDIFG